MHPRFFHSAPYVPGNDFVLPEAIAHHLDRVLRLRPGDPLVLFDGAGKEYAATLLATGRKAVVRVDGVTERSREAPLAITLVQALATADKMDWIVQKAVELGVRSVQPVAAERSVLRLDGERAQKRVAHWRQVAESASEQCGRNTLMAVEPVLGLAQWLGQPGGAQQRWILAPEGGERLTGQIAPQTPVALLIGPEGGWSDKELAAARLGGCKPVSLGPRVLRTETAGLAAVAAMLALWGDF